MTGVPIGKPRDYHLNFNIEQGGRAISGVKLTLVRFIEKDMNARFNVAFMEDPLFPALIGNIFANARIIPELGNLIAAARAASAAAKARGEPFSALDAALLPFTEVEL